MSEEKDTTQKKDTDQKDSQENKAKTDTAKKTDQSRSDNKPTRRRPKGRPGRRQRKPRDFEQKIISIRRVTRVVAGGRRFGFSVTMIIGDGKGSVGVGMGKANDTSLAIQKSINDAKKNMVTLELTEENSIPYDVEAKYKSASVVLMPNHGRGVVAGSAVRSIFELGGIKDVTAKVITRSKNQVNMARATIAALDPFVTLTGHSAVKKSVANKNDNQKKNNPKKRSYKSEKKDTKVTKK